MGGRISSALICRSDDEIQKEADAMGSAAKIGLVLLMILTSVFLMASLGLIIFWVVMYSDGFAWDNTRPHPKVQTLPIKFNFHPTLMIGGFIFFSGFSMLFYRMITCCRKLIIKFLHTLFHGIGIGCVTFGMWAIWESKENGIPLKIPHFYSLHAWLGLATMAMFALQFIVGFFSFLILLCCCESGTTTCRSAFIPTHSTFGLITFSMACATILVGIIETAFSTKKESGPMESGYQWREPKALVINALGVSIVSALALMVFIVRMDGPRSGSAVADE